MFAFKLSLFFLFQTILTRKSNEKLILSYSLSKKKKMSEKLLRIKKKKKGFSYLIRGCKF